MPERNRKPIVLIFIGFFSIIALMPERIRKLNFLLEEEINGLASRAMAELSRFEVDDFEESIAGVSAYTLPLLRNLYQDEAPINIPAFTPFLVVNLRKTSGITEQFQTSPGGKIFFAPNVLSYMFNEGAEIVALHGCASLNFNGGGGARFKTETLLGWQEGEWLRKTTKFRLKMDCFGPGFLMETSDPWLVARSFQEITPWLAEAINDNKYRFIGMLDVLPLNGYTDLVESIG